MQTPFYKQLLLSAGLVLSSSAFASPKQMRVQGHISTSLGAPPTTAALDIQLIVYDAASGGTTLWTSPVLGANISSSGHFEADFDATSGSPSFASAVGSASGALWAEILVDTGTTDGAVMDSPVSVRPRIPLKGTLYSLSALTASQLRGRNVDTLAPVSGQVLMWNTGSAAWIPTTTSAPPATGNLQGATTTVSDSELARFVGTSGKRLQGSVVTISDVGDIASSGNLTISGLYYVSSFSGGQVIATDANSNLSLVGVSVTDAQLNYLSGLSVNIQSQLDAREPMISFEDLISGGSPLTVTNGSSKLVGPQATITLSTASATSPGIVTSLDWSRFNAKQSTLTGVSHQVFRIPGGGGPAAAGTLDIGQTGVVTGTLGTSNGGTGSTNVSEFMTNHSPLASKGDLIVRGVSSNVRLPVGSDGQVLAVSTSIATKIAWKDPPAPDTNIPVGMIVAFGGDTPPTGWVLCDGSSYSRTTYSDLFTAIGTAYGTADGNSFNVPDFRGRFLRGRDGGVGRDPDRASRTAMNTGGATGDNVGSVEGYQIGSHSHSLSAWATWFQPGPYYNGTSNLSIWGYTNTTGAAGGTESRPVNANVNYIIKY